MEPKHLNFYWRAYHTGVEREGKIFFVAKLRDLHLGESVLLLLVQLLHQRVQQLKSRPIPLAGKHTLESESKRSDSHSAAT